MNFGRYLTLKHYYSNKWTEFKHVDLAFIDSSALMYVGYRSNKKNMLLAAKISFPLVKYFFLSVYWFN